MVRFDVEEERGNHADCFLSTDIALCKGDSMVEKGGQTGSTTHDFGLKDQERMKLFELGLPAQDLLGDVELPGKAVWVPRKLNWGRYLLILEDDIAQTGYMDIGNGLIERVGRLPAPSDPERGWEMSPHCIEHFFELFLVSEQGLLLVVAGEAFVVHVELFDEVGAPSAIF
jgi:hypothetical protein